MTLPPEWVWTTLGELAESIKNGIYVSRPGSEPDGVPILRIGAVRPMRLSLDDLRYTGMTVDEVKMNDGLVHPGDLLVTRYNGNLDLVGACARVPDHAPVVAYPDKLIRVVLPAGKVDSRFVAYAWTTSGIQAQVKAHVKTTAGQAGISGSSLKSIRFPVPPLAVQQQIAATLDAVDALRAKRRLAIALLNELTQSVFIEMFGDPAKNPKGWPVRNFEEVVQEFRYGTSNKSTDEGYQALRIPNVVGGVLNLADMKTVPVDAAELKRLRLHDGDMLFVRTNGNQDNVGRCAVFDSEKVEAQGYSADDFIYASYLIRARLRHDRVLPVFAREFMLTPAGRRALREHSKTSAGQFNINIQGIGAVATPLPPLELQREFAARVEVIDAIKKIHRSALATLDELFMSVQSRAFEGTLFK